MNEWWPDHPISMQCCWFLVVQCRDPTPGSHGCKASATELPYLTFEDAHSPLHFLPQHQESQMALSQSLSSALSQTQSASGKFSERELAQKVSFSALGRYGRMWPAREESLEILRHGRELNPGQGKDWQWNTFILSLSYHDRDHGEDSIKIQVNPQWSFWFCISLWKGRTAGTPRTSPIHKVL